MSDIVYPVPSRNLFFSEHVDAGQRVLAEEKRMVPILDESKFANGIEYRASGGVFVHLVGHLFPTKGFPNPQALAANNMAKRQLVNYLRLFSIKEIMFCLSLLVFFPWKSKIKVLEKFLFGFATMGYQILQAHMWLDPKNYTPFCFELRKFLFEFFLNLGISKSTANESAEIFATILEWDDAYRYRAEDVLSETTKELLLKNPRKEVLKLMQLFKERDENSSTQDKFLSVGRLLSTVLLHPRFKKAFKDAITQIDFSKLQLDMIDRYHVMPLGRYKFFGEALETRFERWRQMHALCMLHVKPNKPYFQYESEIILPPMFSVGGLQ